MAALTGRVFTGQREAVTAFVQRMAELLGRALETRGEATAALSGGRTAGLVFDELAQADLDWSKVTLTLIDDRWVPLDHEDSNEKLVTDRLMIGPAAKARFVSLHTPDNDPEQALAEVAKRLAVFEGPFDVVYLGMGPDGHIASLFPDDPTWEGRDGALHAVPKIADRQARISLMPNRLFDAKHILLLTGGPAQRDVWEAAQATGPARDLPIRLMLQQERAPFEAFLYD